MSTKYTYSISNDFPNEAVAPDKLESEISDSSITVALDYINTNGDDCEIWFKADLTAGQQTTLANVVGAHDGEPLTSSTQVEVSNAVDLYATNSYGRLKVHETSRVAGTTTFYTGAGDDPSDITDVGNGTKFVLHHRTGDSMEQTLYLDWNVVENITYIHEGYMIWKDAQFDTITFEVVSRTVSVTSGTNTNYNLYGGYMVVPAAGDGTISLLSDITTPHGGLVHIPSDENGERSIPCYWNADWNSTTKVYENITAAPLGNGAFNMFTVEMVLNRFVNKIPMLGEGFEMMQSADADPIGQGMRLKTIMTTNEPDHYWSVGCILTLHRAKTI